MTMANHARKDRAVILCGLFLFSGFTALVYQIVWVRLLTLTFGASAFAVAAVLIAFMGGMSAGAFFIGRFVDKQRNQLTIYALLELAIGCYALLLPSVVKGFGYCYVLVYQSFTPGLYSISLIRLGVSILILLVPTAAMGATLPLLCSFAAKNQVNAPRRTALLYAINTFGGVLGCLIAGFILIPAFGLHGTTALAVACNVFIAAAGLSLKRYCGNSAEVPCDAQDRRAARPVPSQKEQRNRPASEPARSSLVAIGTIVVTSLSGFTAMAYETLWTRVLSMVIGTTIYAFTTMLAAFLTGLVVGSGIYYLRPARRPFLALAVCQTSIGLWVLLTMPYFDHLPFVFLKVFEWSHRSWPLFQSARFLMLFVMLLIPTTLFGLSFPLAVQMVVRKAGETGRQVGRLYGFNTLGNILGAFVGGFVLIPFVGLQQGMLIAAVVNIIGGLLIVALDPDLQSSRKVVVGGCGAVAATFAACLLSPWNLCYLNSGAYVYAGQYSTFVDLKTVLKEYQPVFYREGPTGTVAVIRSPDGTLSLTIDGKTDASTGQKADMSTQILLSHLPAMFVERPRNVLLIGLGSGVSLGSVLQHPVEQVDTLEVSKEVVEASSCFRDYNHDALSDPRVNLIIADGRHHLDRTFRRYDLIISQPSNPWITGVANLFTQEYYRLMSSRLTDTGVACQWVPSYHMSKEMLGVVCKTFTEVFPNTSLWTSSVVGDLFLVGSNRPLKLDYRLFCERLASQGISTDLARIGLRDAGLLAKTFKYGPEGIRGFLAGFDQDLPTNRDMFPILEFASPRYLLTQRVARDFKSHGDLAGDLAQLIELMSFSDDSTRQSFIQDMRPLMLGAGSTPAMLP